LGLAAGLGDQLWYTLTGAAGCNDGKIVAFSTVNDSASVYPLPSGLAAPANIVEGADAQRMWFTLQHGTYAVSSVSGTDTFSPYKVSGAPPASGIALGSDHRAWFGLSAGFIGAVTTTGSTAITRYRLHSAADVVGSTAAGADGNIWFANAGSNGSAYGIGKISVSGVGTDYLTKFRTKDVARGVGGVMWFTVAGQSKVGFVSTVGTDLTLFGQGISGIPNQIVTGPDGNEYFDELVPGTGQAAVAKITPAGSVTEYALPYGFNPGGLAVGPDGNIWVIDQEHDQLGQLILPPSTTLDYYRFETGVAGQPITTVVDSSAHPRSGSVLSGTPSYSAAVPVASVPSSGVADKLSLQFNTGDSLVFSYPFPFQTLDDATLEFWVYPSSAEGPQEQDIIWGTVGTGDQNRFLIAINNNGTGTVGLNYRDPSGVAHLLGTSTTAIPYNKWTFLAFVKRGSTYSIYVNDSATKGATLLESTVTDTSPNLPNSPGWTINGRIVESPYNCCQFDGLLDEVRISDAALSPSEFLVAKP
jgi:streptogramin lyase